LKKNKEKAKMNAAKLLTTRKKKLNFSKNWWKAIKRSMS
jgi:hypothetical protein